MIGMGSNPFFTGTEVSFNDCPLSDFSKGYSLEKINKVDLDRPLAKDMDAVQNFSNKLEQGRRELTTTRAEGYPGLGRKANHKMHNRRRWSNLL